jgi:linoleoyl-CoA desaturase
MPTQQPRNPNPPVRPAFSARKGEFYSEVNRRAKRYFQENGLRQHATLGWQVGSLLLVLLTLVLLYPAFVKGWIAFAVLLGIVRAVAILGPGHSMSHFAFFRSVSTNTQVFRVIAPLLLTTHPVWNLTHVIHHHIYTLTSHDMQDLYPIKRVQAVQPMRGWHRFQHVYMWPLYALGLVFWQLLDLVRAASALVSKTFLERPFSFRQAVETLIGQAVTIGLHVVLPFFFLPPLQALAVSLTANVTAALVVILQIVVNHEVTLTPGGGPAPRGCDWGEHQVRTSHNYGAASWLCLHMSGGLNFQIEHHLFPRVHYVHYPALAAIVRDTCREFALPYHSSETLGDALVAHYKHLRLMSDAVPSSL